MDFYQPQQLITAKPGSGKGGGSNSEYASAYNAKGASSNQTEEGLSERDSKGNSAGGGTSRGKPVLQLRTLSAGALNDWQNRWIDLPVAYWVEQNAVLDNHLYFEQTQNAHPRSDPMDHRHAYRRNRLCHKAD